MSFLLFLYVLHSLIINPSFEEGVFKPKNWEMNSLDCFWSDDAYLGERSLAVKGSGEQNNYTYWYSDSIQVRSNSFYQFSFYSKISPNSVYGFISSGLNIANYDFNVGEEWSKRYFSFLTPDEIGEVYIKIGQWEKKGIVWFDQLELIEVSPIFQIIEDYSLGSGEWISNGNYYCISSFLSNGFMLSRNIISHNARYNTNRWIFDKNSYLILCHDLNTIQQISGQIFIYTNFMESGSCIIDVSVDNQNWNRIASITNSGNHIIQIPENMYPSKQIFIKISSNNGSFTLINYLYQSNIEQDVDNCFGSTLYPEIILKNDEISILGYKEIIPGKKYGLIFEISDLFKTHDLNLFTSVNDINITNKSDMLLLSDNEILVTFEIIETGENEIHFELSNQIENILILNLNINISDLYSENYGYYISDNNDYSLWWCEPEYKVSKFRSAPEISTKKPIQIYVAKNEFEPFQIIINLKENFGELNIKFDDFISVSGDIILNEQVKIFREEFVDIFSPSDWTGSVGSWPDPLIPINGTIHIEDNINIPLWIELYIPPTAASGKYLGYIHFSSGNSNISVPIEINVYDFQLPVKTHLITSFGLDKCIMEKYYNIETEHQMDTVLKLYYKNFSNHRISPYYPYKSYKYFINDYRWTNAVIDSAEIIEKNYFLKISDEDNSRSIASTNNQLMPIDINKKYLIAWKVKTIENNQHYMVSLNFYDHDTNWILHQNFDIDRVGYTNWKIDSMLLSRDIIPENAVYLKIYLRPVIWTRDGELTGVAWFDDIYVSDIESDSNLVINGDFESTSQDFNVSFDFSNFDSSLQVAFDSYNFNSFRYSIPGIGSGTYHSHSEGTIRGFQQYSPEYIDLFKLCSQIIQNHFNQMRYLEKGYLFWFDEPDLDDYVYVREKMNLIHKYAPKLRRLITEEPTESLIGYVEIWCPLTDYYQHESCSQRRDAGEEIWWYICTASRTPYPTLFIDHPGIELRIWIWMAWKYMISGIMIWNTNYWTSETAFPDGTLQNPYLDPMSYLFGYGFPDGFIDFWGNGDGRFLYPPKEYFSNSNNIDNPPVNSIRWQLLREGLEDYEYFWLLDSLVKENQKDNLFNLESRNALELLTIPEFLISNVSEYTDDPRLLHLHRKNIAEYIEFFLN